MSTVHDSHFGAIDEVTYGTPVLSMRSWEFIKETIAGKYDRIESEGIRAGTRTLREDRFVPNPKGAAGAVDLEVLNMGFGFWLKHMLGTVGTTGAGPYTHTATEGTLAGKSFTAQVNRVDSGGADNVYTYEGGKIPEWELNNAVDGVLKGSLGMDFEAETIGAGAGAYAKMTPAFPSGAILLSFINATFQIGGVTVPIDEVSFKGNNGLKTDRFSIRGSANKREPKEAPLREYTWQFKAEFESTAQAQRVASLTAAGALASISAVWATPDAAHSLTLTGTKARFDEGSVNVDGLDLLTQTVSGKFLQPTAGGSPVTIAYLTPDATP